MYILVHNLNRVLFNTNVHTYTASPVLYYYQLISACVFSGAGTDPMICCTPGEEPGAGDADSEEETFIGHLTLADCIRYCRVYIYNI